MVWAFLCIFATLCIFGHTHTHKKKRTDTHCSRNAFHGSRATTHIKWRNVRTRDVYSTWKWLLCLFSVFFRWLPPMAWLHIRWQRPRFCECSDPKLAHAYSLFTETKHRRHHVCSIFWGQFSQSTAPVRLLCTVDWKKMCLASNLHDW